MAKIRVERRDDGVAIVMLDHPDKPVNTLSPDLLREFQEQVAPLLDDPAVRAIVVASAKPDTFIAGADLEVIEGLTAAEISAMSRDGNALLERIATHPKPVVAAVHGAALGGGLEVALACHYIIASSDPATVLGQPEVQLGLLPAGGATQRLVERVGLDRRPAAAADRQAGAGAQGAQARHRGRGDHAGRNRRDRVPCRAGARRRDPEASTEEAERASIAPLVTRRCAAWS